MGLRERRLAATTEAALPGARAAAPAVTRVRAVSLPAVLLAFAILLFTGWFGAYSVRLHDAHLTHKADLGQIDQAIWNTSRGRFVQEVVGDHLSTRLTDHAEPIFVPLSAIFWLWDDVRALLWLQALALGLGALPVYLLARRRLSGLYPGDAAGWAALALAVAYLLAPPLQAAAVAEFHALPLAPPLVGWALWAAERRQWLRFVLASLLLIAVQEGLALLGVTLGLYVLAREAWHALVRGPASWAPRFSVNQTPRFSPQPGVLPASERSSAWPALAAGVFVTLAGLAWFYAATFVIIPHFAGQAYGLDQTPYAARYGALGDSFGAVIKSILLRPAAVARVLAEPLRLRYLALLLAPSGLLALLAPELLLLGLPLLLANVLSAFPFQYAGELHYSAPLVPYVALAAAVGLARGLRWLAERTRFARSRAWLGLALLPVAGGLVVQVLAGYTPIGAEFWRRSPSPWPAVTAHDRLLDRFAAQIPAAAPASATSDLFPHLSHRPLLYQFPEVGQAGWVLADVSGTTDRHPAAVRDRLLALLDEGWGVVDAADGYLLLRRGLGAPSIPDAFYDFARAGQAFPASAPAGGTGAVQPQIALDLTFGGRLRLLGYDVLDEPRWRRTAFRFYWQVLEPLPAGAAIGIQALAPDGAVAADTGQVPMPAQLWYPPDRWKPGEIVRTQTLPYYLPAAFAVQVTAGAGDQALPAAGCPADLACAPGGAVRLAPLRRVDGRLAPLAGWPAPAAAGAHFRGPDWDVTLAGFDLPAGAPPGGRLPVLLRWGGANGEPARPAGRDYTVFVHLRDAAGNTVANADATPTYFQAMPVTQWSATWGGPDAHTLLIPPELAPGRYAVVAGWYDWRSGERLKLLDAQENVAGDETVLGTVEIAASYAVQPDLACLLAPEACASQ